MASGWLLSPVIGVGTPSDPIRPQVGGRDRQDGDRLEYVIGAQDRCLVAYDVADDTNMADFGGVMLTTLVGLDDDETGLPAARRNQLRRLAQDVGVGDRGSVREVVRRVGRKLVGSHFHEGIHLGSGRAPRPGSFVVDTFTDADGTNFVDHTPDTGSVWVLREGTNGGVISDANRVRSTTSTLTQVHNAASPASAEYDVAVELHWQSYGEWANGVSGRSDASANTHYYAYFYDTPAQWQLWKVVAGSYTSLGNFAEGAPANPSSLVLEIRDATKKLYVGGVERVSSADNAITAAGHAGVKLYGSTSNTTGSHLDNFAASDAGGPPPPTTVPKLRVVQSNMRLA